MIDENNAAKLSRIFWNKDGRLSAKYSHNCNNKNGVKKDFSASSSSHRVQLQHEHETAKLETPAFT